MLSRPIADEFPAYGQRYLDRVPDGDVLAFLRAQGERSRALLATVPPAKEGYAYAPGKWSVKRLWQHVVDGERLFAYRALCIARGDTQALPGFDEDAYAAQDGSEARSLADITAEYATVRAASSSLFAGLGASAWTRRGIANGNPVSVRALPWIIAGHELHHLAVLRERYGLG